MGADTFPTPAVLTLRSRYVVELPRTPRSRLDGRLALVTGAGRAIGLVDNRLTLLVSQHLSGEWP
jgi:hypothetical protein